MVRGFTTKGGWAGAAEISAAPWRTAWLMASSSVSPWRCIASRKRCSTSGSIVVVVRIPKSYATALLDVKNKPLSVFTAWPYMPSGRAVGKRVTDLPPAATMGRKGDGKLNRPRLFRIILIGCLTLLALAVGTWRYREHVRTTHNFMAPAHWPPVLKDLIAAAHQEGDLIDGVECRSVGLLTTVIWRMPATDSRLQLHLERFQLQPDTNDGRGRERILGRWPYPWSPPSATANVYVFPPGLPPAQDGEHEMVLLHDEANQMLYMFHYFNF